MIHTLVGELEQFLIKTDTAGQINETLWRNTSRFNELNALLASTSNTDSIIDFIVVH